MPPGPAVIRSMITFLRDKGVEGVYRGVGGGRGRGGRTNREEGGGPGGASLKPRGKVEEVCARSASEPREGEEEAEGSQGKRKGKQTKGAEKMKIQYKSLVTYWKEALLL